MVRELTLGYRPYRTAETAVSPCVAVISAVSGHCLLQVFFVFVSVTATNAAVPEYLLSRPPPPMYCNLPLKTEDTMLRGFLINSCVGLYCGGNEQVEAILVDVNCLLVYLCAGAEN